MTSKECQPGSDAALYVHLWFDGGIIAMREDGVMKSVSVARLKKELANVKAAHGVLLYSREKPEEDAPDHVNAVFQGIMKFELPIRLMDEPHPALKEKDKEYYTPLMGASFRKDNDWVSELVARGVDLETKDSYGQTALMFAANAGNTEAVRILVHAGASVDARDNQNSTPLMYAAQHGFRESVIALLAAGADARAKGDHGLSALGFAEQNRHFDVIALLEAL